MYRAFVIAFPRPFRAVFVPVGKFLVPDVFEQDFVNGLMAGLLIRLLFLEPVQDILVQGNGYFPLNGLVEKAAPAF